MSTPRIDIPRHRITVDEYYRMAELGILAPDARVELIEGEIIDMTPQGSGHQHCLAVERAPHSVAARARWSVSCRSG
jgi:Uma2 family endonuclease